MYDDKKDALLLIFITHIAARGAELAEMQPVKTLMHVFAAAVPGT